MSRGNPGIKARPGVCSLRIQENDTRDALVTVADPQNGSSRTIAYIQIGAESWGPLLAAAPDLANSAAAFLKWFRVFIGDKAYNEIRADELDDLRAALSRATL